MPIKIKKNNIKSHIYLFQLHFSRTNITVLLHFSIVNKALPTIENDDNTQNYDKVCITGKKYSIVYLADVN